MKRIVVIIIMFCLYGCSFGLSGVEKTIQNYEDAINERNMDSMLECFTPSFQSKMKKQLTEMKMATKILGVVTEVDISDFINNDTFSYVLDEGLEGNTVEIKIIDIQYNNDETRAEVKANMINGDKEEIGTFKMSKISRKWYIDPGKGML